MFVSRMFFGGCFTVDSRHSFNEYFVKSLKRLIVTGQDEACCV